MKKGIEIWIQEGFKAFGENGIKGLGVRDLSRRVGVGKTSLYYHFDNLEGFFDEVVDYWFHLITEKTFEVVNACNSPKEGFFKMAELTDKKEIIAFSKQIWNLGPEYPSAFSKALQARRKREEFLVDLYVRAGFDRSLVEKRKELLFSLTHGAQVRTYENPNMPPEERKDRWENTWNGLMVLLKTAELE